MTNIVLIRTEDFRKIISLLSHPDLHILKAGSLWCEAVLNKEQIQKLEDNSISLKILH